MHRLLPFPALDLGVRGTEGLLEAYAYPEGRVWLRANMVATVDGAAQGPDGRSASISTPSDRTLFAALRGLADVILAGAGTVRTERYGPAEERPAYASWRAEHRQAAAPDIAVVSRSLRFDLDSPLFADPDRRPVVITVAASDEARRTALAEVADVVVAGEDDLDPAAAVAALADRGHRRLLCEGGATLLRDLVSHDVLDELCVTVSPLLAAGDAPRLLAGDPLDPPGVLRLAGLLEQDGTLFARYQRAGAGRGGG